MQQTSKKITIILLLILFSHPCLAQELRVALCYDPNTPSFDKGSRVPTMQSLHRVATAIDENYKVELKIRECKDIPNFSFYASKEAVFGREEAVARIVKSAEWIAAEEAFIYLNDQLPERGILEARKLTWVDVYRLGSAQIYTNNASLPMAIYQVVQSRDLTAEDVNSLLKLASDIHDIETRSSSRYIENEILDTSLKLYQAIIDYAFAFLFGHEFSHYLGEKCPIDGIPAVKEKGIWKTLRKLQDPGGLYNPRIKPDLHELRADACGLHFMEMVDKAVMKRVTDPYLVAHARRAAIDLLAGPILLGLNGISSSNIMAMEQPQVDVVDDYLYPQTRLTLISATLRLREQNFPWAIKICNDTAKAMVTIIQDAVASYPESNGDVPDEVLNEFPTGVTQGWQTGRWNEDSFKCKPGGIE